jgi:hypothetical protein
MFRKILPKEYKFYDFFNEHIALIVSLCKDFLIILKDSALLAEGRETLKKTKKELDKIEVATIEAIHKTFITPMDRIDIYNLITVMTSIASSVNTTLSRINMYQIWEIRAELVQNAENLLSACEELQKALLLLKDNKNYHTIREHCKNVRKLESECDMIYRSAIQNLFQGKDAIEIIKWKDVFDRLEKGIDRCQSAANILEEIMIDNL